MARVFHLISAAVAVFAMAACGSALDDDIHDNWKSMKKESLSQILATSSEHATELSRLIINGRQLAHVRSLKIITPASLAGRDDAPTAEHLHLRSVRTDEFGSEATITVRSVDRIQTDSTFGAR